MFLLDRYLPTADIAEHHTLVVAAPPEAVLEAAHELRCREVPLQLVLMSLRGLPRLLRRRSVLKLDGKLVDELVRLGFVRLEQREDEVAYGVTGRFWSLDGGLRRIGPDDFERFDEPGWAQGALAFSVAPHPLGTLLSTETRVRATDPGSLRAFRRYWRVIYPGSALIRLEWLRAIRRRAQR
jgi:hypothetical protein